MNTNVFDTKYKHCYTCGLVFRRENIVEDKCVDCLLPRKTKKCACGKCLPKLSLCAYCYWERDCEHGIIRVKCNTCNVKKRSVKLENGLILKKFE